jgi:hypothetical protein
MLRDGGRSPIGFRAGIDRLRFDIVPVRIVEN